MLREQKSILTPDEMAKLDTKPMRDECGFEYLKARLTRLEVLVGVRDSNLHPGLMGASLLLHECNVSHGNLIRQDSLTLHSAGAQGKKRRCGLYPGDHARASIAEQKGAVL